MIVNASAPASPRLVRHRLRLGALDHEPQHELYLPEEGRLGDRKYLALVLWPQHAGKAQAKVGEVGPFSPRLIRSSSLCAQLFSSKLLCPDTLGDPVSLQ
jgi:hypothetical protein